MNFNVTAAITGVLGLAVGSAATYLITNKRIELKYAILLDEEVDAVKQYYRLLRKDDGAVSFAGDDDGDEDSETPSEQYTPSDEDLAKNSEIVEMQGYSTSSDDNPVVRKNVFDKKDEGEEETEEEIFPEKYAQLPDRDPDAPYIIGVDEWVTGIQNGSQYEKEQLTYFEGDDTLVNSDGNIVNDVATFVGIKNLNYFGMGSDNDDIVYIRNEALEKDFEVFKEDVEYTVKVLGLPSSYTSHSTTSKIRKMRDDD